MKEEEEIEYKSKDSKAPIFLLGILFLPGLLVGLLFFSFLRNFKFKPSFISFIAFITTVITLAVGYYNFNPQDPLSLENLIMAYIVFNVILGAVGGTIYDIKTLNDLKRNPEKLEIPGLWSYKLKLRNTPFENRKIRKKIAKLRNGDYVEEDRAPIGLEEEAETTEVVYRYDDEAVKHTLLTGASGSGKALPLNTEIATPEGFVKLENLQIGDEVFDSNGLPTKIISFSEITEETEYEISFFNEEKIITSGDHRFVVYTGRVREAIEEGELDNFFKLPEEVIEKIKTLLSSCAEGEYITIPEYEALTQGKPSETIIKFFNRFGVSHEGEGIVGYPKKPVLEGLLKLSEGHSINSFPERMTVKEMLELTTREGEENLLSLAPIKPVQYGEKVLPTSPYEFGRIIEEKEKNIPIEFLQGSIKQRSELLKGLIEAKGEVSKEGVILSTSDKNLAEEIVELISSLGLSCEKTLQKNGVAVSFNPGTEFFGYEKRTEPSPDLFANHRVIKSIKKLDKVSKMRCLSVESDTHEFLVGRNYIPTSNTITLLSLIRKNILMHQPVVVIDFKRSSELASKLAAWTEEAGGNFYHFVNGKPENYDVEFSPGQVLYDPLSSGTPGTNADMILGMREYDPASEHYKTNMQQLLQVIFKMLYFGKEEIEKSDQRRAKANHILKHNPPQDPQKLTQIRKIAAEDRVVENARNIEWDSGGLYLLASAIKPENFPYLVEICKRTEAGPEAEQIMALYSERQNNMTKHSIQELQGQLRTITSSEYGRWLKTEKDGNNLNLLEVTQEPGSVVLFSLNSDSEPEFAKFMGSIILSDLTNLSAMRRNRGLKNLVNVYVDEFQAVPPTSVTSLLEKSRESRVAMTLAQQSFDQIIASSKNNGQAYLGSILDTCSNFIIHAGATEPSAIKLAEILGKEKKTKYVFSHGKRGKKRGESQEFQTREEMDWIFDPSEFMSLTMPDRSNDYKATAVMVNKTSSEEKFRGRKGAVARKVWMIPDQRVLDEYYEPNFEDGYSSSKNLDDSIDQELAQFSDDFGFESSSEFNQPEQFQQGDQLESSFNDPNFNSPSYGFNDPMQVQQASPQVFDPPVQQGVDQSFQQHNPAPTTVPNQQVSQPYNQQASKPTFRDQRSEFASEPSVPEGDAGFGFEDDYQDEFVPTQPYTENLSSQNLFKGEGLNIGVSAPRKVTSKQSKQAPQGPKKLNSSAPKSRGLPQGKGLPIPQTNRGSNGPGLPFGPRS